MHENYDIAAYFWPAYHDEPRWRRFMPAGEGEWETIKHARPKFDGHEQPRVPLWGYESDSDPLAMERKIDAAVSHGVNVFIFDWYWYENQPFLEDSLNKGFLQARNRDRMRFYLMWANHNATTLWDLKRSDLDEFVFPGAVDLKTFQSITRRIIESYFPNPSYYRIDGKPVFSIYDLSSLLAGLGGVESTREALEQFRVDVIAAGFPGLHLQAILWAAIPAEVSLVPGDTSVTQANTIQRLGFDSLTSYQWCHIARPVGDYRAWAAKAMAPWRRWSEEFPIPYFPHVSVGWDTNPRFQQQTDLVTGGTPDLFEEYLTDAMAFVDELVLTPRLITVNSWNEWSEGSYLEPDTKYGTAYLEAVKRAVMTHSQLCLA